MKSLMIALLTISSLFVFTGCWDKAELTTYGFVQAVALDQTSDGKIQLTTHFYKPGGVTGDTGGQKGGSKYINIKSEGVSTFEGVRDITMHFGRKAKWDHMRVILIGEQLAKTKSARAILDFFARDHEPRPTVTIIITQGKAGDYLNIKPFIEYTMGQQLRKIEKAANRFSGKTIVTTMLDFFLQAKSETGVATVPYANLTGGSKKRVSMAGIALLKNGKLVDVVPPQNAKDLIILTNKYHRGVIQVPCAGKSAEKNRLQESVEVRMLKTKIKLDVKGNLLDVRISTRLEGTTAELRCSSLKTSEETKAFEKHVKKALEGQLRTTIRHLQKNQIDAIGIGNYLYRSHPQLWNKWKKEWGERFARSNIEVDVDVTIDNTGMYIGKPLSK